jgi:predicted phage terminase large subunit-like protein
VFPSHDHPGWPVKADIPGGQGSKEVRADPYAAQVQGGNVLIVRGDWNRAFLDEHEMFPNGKYKDQVDAAAMAFSGLNKTGFFMVA